MNLPPNTPREEFENAVGLLNVRPARVRIRRRPFGQIIRELPRCARFESFGYVSWVLFLTLFYIAHHVPAFCMTTRTFSNPRGIGFRLSSTRVTAEMLESFRGGATLKDEQGRVVLDPALHCVRLAEPGARTSCACGPGDDRRPRILLRADENLTYSQVVSALDALQLADCFDREVVLTDPALPTVLPARPSE